MKPRILFVDDDTSAPGFFCRQFGDRYETQTAASGREALAAVDQRGPFAVVVCDLRMPEMDGIQCLARVRVLAPDTTRILLSGYVQTDAAIDAVNRGHVFCLLTKPVTAGALEEALADGVAQHRQAVAEREMLDQTLNSSVTLLTDLLGVASPASLSRAARLRRYVRHMARRLGRNDLWQFEIAATLSQLDSMTPPQGAPEAEDPGRAEARRHSTAADRLASIPRMQAVSRMIARLHEPADALDLVGPPERWDAAALGAHLLGVAVEFDRRLRLGKPPAAALAEMEQQPGTWCPALLAALRALDRADDDRSARFVTLADLDLGMIFDQDVHACNGMLLVARGQEVTEGVLRHLHNFAEGVGIEEPLCVVGRGKTPSSADSRVTAGLAAAESRSGEGVSVRRTSAENPARAPQITALPECTPAGTGHSGR